MVFTLAGTVSNERMQDHGTYNNSWTWFDAIVPATICEATAWQPKRRRVLTNVHACSKWEKHEVLWSCESEDPEERAFVTDLARGQWIELEVHAKYSGWANHVLNAQIDVFTAIVR
jgi:hypothetical protein